MCCAEGRRDTMSVRMRSWLACALVVALNVAGAASFPAVAHAGEAEDQQRAAARDMAKRGADAFDAGDFGSAYDLFRRAHALMPVPSLSVFEARSAEKLGRLIEAMEAYEKTVRYALATDAPEPFIRAVDEARREMGALRPRIPRLRVVVDGRGADDADLKVEMDGVELPRALVGVVSPANPGSHRLRAFTPWGAAASATVTLAERETQTATLVLEGGDPGAGADTAPVAASSPGRATPAPKTDRASAAGGTQRTVGFIALGVGAAGLGVGVVTGFMAVGKHDEAEKACPDRKCVEGSAGDAAADDFRSLRTFSTLGYVVGAVGAVGGATLVLTAPSSAQASAVVVRPWVGVASAGVGGRF